MSQKLTGRAALVTGGGGLIGAATCKLLAAHGAAVMVADIVEETAKAVSEDITAQGGTSATVLLDVADDDSVEAAVAATVATFGRLDILHNNAAPLHLVRQDNAFLELPMDIWDQTFATMLRGPALLAQHALPHLIEGGVGSIINTSSIQSLLGDTTMAAYSSAKSGINAFTRALATQYGRVGVRCNAVAPGHITSERVTPEVRDKLVRNQVIGRAGQPDDIAKAVLYLASDDSSFVTGQILVVDGGMSIHMPTYSEGGTLAK